MSALADALATTRRQLEEERAAVERCRREGWATDQHYAERHAFDLAALVQRLELRLAGYN